MAAEVMVGALLSASLEVLIKRMASSEVLEFFQRKRLNDKLLKKMKLKLLSADEVLNDAENKQIENPNVKKWLDELQNVIYEAQDLMDNINTKALERSVEGGSSTSLKVQNLISTAFTANKKVRQTLKEILDRLETILKEKDRLRLQSGVQNIILPRTTPATSLVEESGVYGRDADKEAIMKFLLSDVGATSQKISVIPIVGMGGIGKTTLAQLVYNDDRVKKCFDYKVWVHVSEEFDIFKITKVIADRVTRQTYDGQDLDILQVRLEENLKGKKFLLILDDVWNEKYTSWDELKKPFESGACGSKIIVTTRNEGVASVMRDVPSYQLGTLHGDECWKLFVKHAFNNVHQPSAHPKLEEIGRKIVHKCRGLPLAIKLLGGLLRHQLNLEEWVKILNSDIWELPKEKNSILPALWLSYYYLPAHLKRCFAFCSMFPKSHKIDKDDLIKLWMAEDLIQPSQKKAVEEVGEEYSHELLSRSLFQQSKGSGQSIYLSMHDLVNDLATFIGGEFYLRWNDGDSNKSLSKIRHLSHFRVRDDHLLLKYEDLAGAKQLRTMFLYSSCYSDGIQLQKSFLTLSGLRVLSLYGNPMSKLPDSIGNLKSLRYLDLSLTKIEELPNTVCTLYNLQTMLLRNCSMLKRLPTNIGKLINLRHLELKGTYHLEDCMLIGMGNLKDLQTLTYLIVGKHGGGCTIKELQGLQLLRGSLRILKLENVVDAEDVVVANLKDKQYLSDLEYDWTWSSGYDDKCPPKHEEVLNGLQPHTNIKFLKISSYRGERFPNWVGDYSFCNLEQLRLFGCNNCCLLPPLGQLPFLKQLEIGGFDKLEKIGDEFYYGRGCSMVTKPFRHLESLQISNMRELQEWSFIGGEGVEHFPSLKKLCLRYFPKLSGGLCLLANLETVILRGCNKLEFPGKQCYASLRRLEIRSSCHFMTSIHLDYLPMLNELLLEDLQSLESLTFLERPASPSEVMFLKHMELYCCPEFVSFPQGGLSAPNMQELWIVGCNKLRSLPEHMDTLLPSLQSLQVIRCPELESFGEGGLPSNLNKLTLHSCDKISTSDFQYCNLHTLTSLTELNIIIKDGTMDSFPKEGMLPTSLTRLSIQSSPRLKALNGKTLSLKNWS